MGGREGEGRWGTSPPTRAHPAAGVTAARHHAPTRCTCTPPLPTKPKRITTKPKRNHDADTTARGPVKGLSLGGAGWREGREG